MKKREDSEKRAMESTHKKKAPGEAYREIRSRMKVTGEVQQRKGSSQRKEKGWVQKRAALIEKKKPCREERGSTPEHEKRS